jgi:uncharacterized protein YndB with AHSA1/START domain
MADATQISTPADAPELIGSRLFDAPRALVFEAFSTPEHLARWFGPAGFSLTTHEMNFAPGGIWRFTMHGPDGRDYPNRIVYREIERPARIAFTQRGDESAADPAIFETTIVFADAAGKTRVDWRMRFASLEARDRVLRDYGAAEGLAQTLARLAECVAAEASRSFVITRDFDAPVDLLWRALTEPERIAQWQGAEGASMMEFRPGGRFHYSQKAPDGGVLWGLVVYQEIDAPRRLVAVQGFSDENGGAARHPMRPQWPLRWLSIHELESTTAGASLTLRWRPQDASDAESAAFLGDAECMTQGWTHAFNQLADYLARH